MHQHLTKINHVVFGPNITAVEIPNVVFEKNDVVSVETFFIIDVFSTSTNFLIESISPAIKNAEYVFRKWEYAACDMNFQKYGPKKRICFDTGCTMTLKNNIWDFENKMKKTASFIPIRNLGNKIHYSNEYSVFDGYIQKINKNIFFTAHIRREIHIVEDFKVNIFIGIDILVSKNMLLDLGRKTLCIESCQNFVTNINIIFKSEFNFRRIIRIKSRITVPSHVFMKIPVQIKGSALPSDRDFLFEFNYAHDLKHNGGFYIRIIDVFLSMIQLKNESDKPVIIQRHVKLKNVTEYNGDGCFMVNSKKHFLAVTRWNSHPQKIHERNFSKIL